MVVAATVLVSLHRTWSQVVLTYTFLVALWGLLLFFRRSEPSGSYLAALIIAEGVVAVQAVIGIILFAEGHRPASTLHFLYGLATFLTLPTAYLYSRGATVRGSSLILSLASFFLFGLGIRAITTGGT